MHAPITRYEMQPAGSDRTEKQLGHRGTVPERKTVGSLSEDASYHTATAGTILRSVRYAVPTARFSAWEALEVRHQQHSTRLLFPGVKIASASAVALNPPFATRPSAGCGPQEVTRARARSGWKSPGGATSHFQPNSIPDHACTCTRSCALLGRGLSRAGRQATRSESQTHGLAVYSRSCSKPRVKCCR